MFIEGEYEIYLVSPDYQGVFNNIDEISDGSSRLSGPTLSKAIYLMKSLRFIKKGIKDFEPDFIIAHNFEPGIAVSFLKKSIKQPIIYIPHSLLQRELKTYFRNFGLKGLFNYSGERLDRRVLKSVDKVIALTTPLKYYLQERYGTEQAYCIPPPFIPHRYFEKADKRPDGKTLFYCGNADGYQNLDILLEAVMVASELESKIRLIIASNSPLSKWRRIIKPYEGRINMDLYPMDKFDETVKLALKSDAALFTRTDAFGYPMKIHFYIQCGLPIVAFDTDLPGLINDETAFLAPQGDIGVLSDYLLTALRDKLLAQSISDRAYDYFESSFNFGKILKEFERLAFEI